MRFQTMEQVSCDDPELVLAVLEDRLQTLRGKVVREGERITLYGLGPSPRAVNPRDTTVIDVRGVNGTTMIDVDVNFQASAFVGEMAQDEIVRSKLERVFEETKEQVHFEAQRRRSKTIPLPVRVVAETESSVAVSEPRGADSVIHVERFEPQELHGDEVRLAEEEPIADMAAPAMDVAPVEVSDVSAAVMEDANAEIEESDAVKSSFLLPGAIRNQEDPQPPAVFREAERGVSEGEDSPKRGGRAGRIALVAGLTVMVTGGAGYLAMRQGANAAEAQTVPATPLAPAPPIIAPVPVAAPSSQMTTPVAAPDPAASDDPAEVVTQWEAAMGTRDASAQAAFYADPVDRYFLRRHVGHDAVVADKQGEIDKRAEGWSVKMDRVTVTRKGDVADVSLVKHFTVQKDGEPPEWFIPSRLQLKREDGKWLIVSERNLGWVTSMDDLEE